MDQYDCHKGLIQTDYLPARELFLFFLIGQQGGKCIFNKRENPYLPDTLK